MLHRLNINNLADNKIHQDRLRLNLFLKIYFKNQIWRVRNLVKLGRIRVFLNSKTGTESNEIYRTQMLKREQDHNYVFGPWMGELGFEILYWGPFVNAYSKPGDYVMSRGGVECFYSDTIYIDLLDSIDNLQWVSYENKRENIFGGEKQRDWTFSELLLCNSIAKISGLRREKTFFIHPKNMFNIYNFNPSDDFEHQLSLLKLFSLKILSQVKNESTNISNQVNSKIALNAVYSRKGLTESQIKEFFESEFMKIKSREFTILNIENKFIDARHSFVPLANADMMQIHSCKTSENLKQKIDQILSCDLVITTDGGLAYLSVLLGKDTVAVRSRENHWSDYHTKLAKSLAEFNAAEYIIVFV